MCNQMNTYLEKDKQYPLHVNVLIQPPLLKLGFD